MNPTKKYTVITRASSGIGAAPAKAFAERSRNLILKMTGLQVVSQ